MNKPGIVDCLIFKIQTALEGTVASGHIKFNSKEFTHNDNKNINISIFPQSVNEWCNLNSTNILELLKRSIYAKYHFLRDIKIS